MEGIGTQYDEGEAWKTEIERHMKWKVEEPERMGHYWRGKIKIDPFRFILRHIHWNDDQVWIHVGWDGHFDCIVIAKHGIELTSKEVWFLQWSSYRAGPKDPYVWPNGDQIDVQNGRYRTICDGRRCSHRVGTKKERSLRFCVHHRTSHTVHMRHSYPIPDLDVNVYSLGDALIFFTPNANRCIWTEEMDDTDGNKTAFTFLHGWFRYSTRPSRFRSAPDTV